MIRHARHLLAAALLAAVVAALGTTPALATFGFPAGTTGFDGSVASQGGSPDTQAGSHPYSLTVGLRLNTTINHAGKPASDGSVKDIQIDTPAGFTGNPTAVLKCTPNQLSQQGGGSPAENCPPGAQVGVAAVRLTISQGNLSATVPVFNMVTPAGRPLTLGFNVSGVNVFTDTKLRTGSDYGATALSEDISAVLPFTGITLTLWGVPADPAHDVQRCWEFSETTGNCFEPHAAGVPPKPFLTVATSCLGPQATTVSADSWENPGVFVQDSFLSHDNSGNPIGNDGCNRLGFTPAITTQPDTSSAATPSGLHVDLHLPQNENPAGLAEAELKDAVVMLPAGVTVNPSSADGLVACSLAQIELSGPNPASCPDASKLGTVEADTPVLDHPLQGSIFLAAQNENPFGSLLAIYIAIADPQTGVVVKVPAHIELDQQTGQLKTIVENSPQLPFEDLKLDFFGGPRAPLVTPASCGVFSTTSDLTPWSSPYADDAMPSDSFAITSGVGGAGCGNGFAPSFSAGTVNNQAGAFSPFTASFARTDQEQDLAGVAVTTPPGLLGVLKGVEQCPEPQAAQGTCGPNSLIGHTTAAAGAGPDPVNVAGQVFLTGPYKGAPFGLSIVVPAVAGPFNLGTVVVRAAVSVDPHTARITVAADPLPTILQGVPLLVKKVNVSIDRPGFMFNPTSCDPLTVGWDAHERPGRECERVQSFPGRELRELAVQAVVHGLYAGEDEQEEWGES